MFLLWMATEVNYLSFYSFYVNIADMLTDHKEIPKSLGIACIYSEIVIDILKLCCSLIITGFYW